MIVLHQGKDASARVRQVAAAADGPVFKRDPRIALEECVPLITTWLAETRNPAAIVIESAEARTPAQRDALRALRRIAKFNGIDVHLVGGDELQALADRVVTEGGDPSPGRSGPHSASSGDMAPFRRVDRPEDDIPTWQEIVATTGCSKEQAQGQIQWMRSLETWVNELYQVDIEYANGGRTAHLIIRRLDRQPARDWQQFQEIKNRLVGPECEAVELYPKESLLVDAKNQYHLWAFTSPQDTFGVGFRHGREVIYDDPDR